MRPFFIFESGALLQGYAPLEFHLSFFGALLKFPTHHRFFSIFEAVRKGAVAPHLRLMANLLVRSAFWVRTKKLI